MIKVIYLDTAKADLKDIMNYYTEISSRTSSRVYEDIYGAIETLQMFPMAGHQLPDGRRRFVSSKYRFVISHKTYEDRIEIVGVYRRQNR